MSVTDFYKNLAGSANKIADFSDTLSPSGDFEKLSDLEVILRSWTNILLTPKGTYDHDPKYGSRLYQMIYEPLDNETQETIQEEVITAISVNDDRAMITSVSVSFLSNYKGFVLSIGVNYDGQDGNLDLTINERDYLKFL